jgi:uroporphyrinogen-III decarboxylase
MWLIVGIMGFKKTVTMIWKHPEEMKEFMGILESEFIKQIDAYRGKPVAELNFGDNMHQDLCPPPYFKEYVIPFYKRMMPLVHAQGMVATSHFDGYLKQLLPLVGETGLDGLECVTPLPQGDVSLEEMKEGMGEMFLRDGIPAVYMCPWTPVKTLKSHVQELMEAFYPRLILGISDLLPANGEVERIRLVKEMVDKFNAEM